MERALREAGLDIDRDQLDQQQRQFTQNLAMEQQRLSAQEDQFLRSLQLDQQRLTQQGQQFTMEQVLRETLGLADIDVRRQQATADTQMAQNQFLLQLAQALGGLSADQIKALFGSNTPGVTDPGGGGTRDGDGQIQT